MPFARASARKVLSKPRKVLSRVNRKVSAAEWRVCESWKRERSKCTLRITENNYKAVHTEKRKTLGNVPVLRPAQGRAKYFSARARKHIFNSTRKAAQGGARSPRKG